MLENFGDTVLSESEFLHHRRGTDGTGLRCAFAIRSSPRINVCGTMGSKASGRGARQRASFVRVNVLCRNPDCRPGLLQAIAHDLLRDRTTLQARSIQIWADVNVKHSAALAEHALEDDVHDLIDRGRADAVIVTGSATGQPIDLSELRRIKSVADSTPIVIGSGVTADSARILVPHADGIIVGSSLKQDGIATNPVDSERVRQLVEAVHAAL